MTELIQVLVLLASLGGLALTMARMNSNARRELQAALSAQLIAQNADLKVSINAVLIEVRRVDTEQDAIRMQTGDTITALRQHINDRFTIVSTQITELGFFIRDGYTRQEVFKETITRLEGEIRGRRGGEQRQ